MEALEAVGLLEVGTEAFRPSLLAGIFTGYSTAALLTVLTIAGLVTEVVPAGVWPFVLIAIKVATNTMAAIAWRTRRLVISLSALNIVADVLLMTGAIYFTGGVLSPLVALYFIEVAVMALLTNVGLTVLTVIGCFVFFTTMAVSVETGALPAWPLLGITCGEMATATTPVMVGFVALTVLAPGVYVAAIVERIRDREQKLQIRAAELAEAGRARSDFTTNITHELRTPLHGILGMVELVETVVYGPVTPEQLEAMSTVRSSATGLLELIDSLLVLARQEALRLEVRESEVDVTEVVASVIASARMLVGTRALELRSEIAGGLPSVRTDRQKLAQILVNLVANAVKFTPEPGTVTVSARAEGASVIITVSDSGRGISPELLSKIFEPYFQVDGTAVREHGGAGIGLSVVRTLCTLLGIEIRVESTLGKGSAFTLEIPRVRQAVDGASVARA